MKFQKGLLDDLIVEQPMTADEPRIVKPPAKDHLFETVHEKTGSERNYLKLLAIVVLLVMAAGGVAAYMMMPRVGDKVRAPQGLDLALRDHFLTSQKRTATDITFYQCDGYYWAEVGVETRNDIPNPLMRVDKYAAQARPSGSNWAITAAPITSAEVGKPCTAR